MSASNTIPIAPNPNVPSVTNPLANVEALVTVTTQLRQGMMSLGGQIGGSFDRAVTLQDLLDLGLVTVPQLAQALRPPAVAPFARRR